MARKRSSFFPRIQSVLKLGLLPCLSVAIALAVVLLPLRITTVASAVPAPDPLLQQSQSLYDRSEYEKAVKLLQQAVASYRQQGDELGIAIALGNLALAYQQLRQWQSAEQAIAESLQLLPNELTASAPILAQILAVRGRWELKQGKTEAALATWQETTTLYRQLKDEGGIIRSQLNQAQALTSLGRYFQAEKALTKTLQQLPPEDSPIKATVLHSLGKVYRSLGNLKRSRQMLEQSLSMATATKSPTGDVYLSLGNTARAEGQPQAALNFYRQAVENASSTATRLQAQLNQLDLLELQAAVQLAKQIESQLESLPPSHTSVSARINLAENWQQLQQKTTTEIVTKAKLISILTAAQQQAEQLGDNSALAYALGNLAQVYATDRELSKAIALTQQALYQGQAVNDPSLTYRWQLQLGRLQQQAGDSSEAIAAYTAAVNSLQALRQNLVALNTQVQFDFRQRVEPVYRELVDLLLRSQPSQADLVLARQTIESLQLIELENFLRQACLEPRADIDELVENDTTAVIYPIILKDRLEIILKLPQTPLIHFTTVVTKDEFDTTVTALRTDLLDVTKTVSVQQQSQQLYTWLIEPLSTALADNQIDTLVFVLDGSLRNIPMSVLHDRQQQQYLIEQYALAIAPGLPK